MFTPLSSAAETTPLYPPTVTPPHVSLSLPRFLFTFARNPLAVLPEAVYRDPFCTYRHRLTWVTDPAVIKKILLDERDRFAKTQVERRALAPLLGNGLLTSDGADWRWQRRTAAPLFRHTDILHHVPAVVSSAERTIAQWCSAAPGTVQRIELDMSHASFRVISETMLAGGDTYTGPAFQRSDLDKLRYTWRMAYAVLGLPAALPYPGSAMTRKAEQRMRTAVLEIVRARRRSPGPRDDLLVHLLGATDLETGRPMPDEQLVDNLLTFLIAGHATTAKALTWALYLVARSPFWERRLLEEIGRVVGDGPLTEEHVDRLTEVTQVVKEAMRLYPPVPEITRIAREDIELHALRLAADSLVIIPIFALHRHRALWDNPDCFDPARFAPAREAQYSRYQYMPFGAGPRVCIGASFAMIEAVVMLAMFVRAARFEVAAGHLPVPVSRVTLWPSGGMPLKVWPR